MKARWRRLIVLVAALAGVALTARLGVWQLDRAAQKLALQATIDTRGALPPLPAGALARDATGAALQHQRRIVLQGRWRPEFSVFLDNRQMDGRPGFYLLTPLELGPGDAVLVQRGWAPRDVRDRARVPAVPTPAGEVRVVGRIAPPPAALYAFDGPDTGTLRQNVDLGAYARETGLALRPLSVLLIDDGDDAGTGTAAAGGSGKDGLQRRWPAPAVDVHKHYGYAFQWFALAILLIGLYVWFQVFQPWLRQRRARA